ncbi:MAG: hypothetical protein M1817_004609 [Caeruleum heppii]|nr:MAG: hypothetical protein M1817_004609 [Caeruleum heppii]
MDRIRSLIGRRSQPYEPVEGGSFDSDGEPIEENAGQTPFSWLDYSIFLLLGVAMLWAWNMFLAAAPYFQRRFESSKSILRHFESATLSVSTITNLGSMLVLIHLQAKASYPKRIASSLCINVACFTLLAVSTTVFRHVTASTYLVFMLAMVFLSSLATGLSQNGVFAYVSGFGRGEYTQAIMTGQAVAGVLPCIAQIVSVLSVPPERKAEETALPSEESSVSAFIYFLTATAVSTAALIAFLYLVPRHQSHLEALLQAKMIGNTSEGSPTERKVVSMRTLFRKLHWLAGAVFICFGVTMAFPVFTQARSTTAKSVPI